MVSSLLGALRLLTIYPLPGKITEPNSNYLYSFPIAGAAIGIPLFFLSHVLETSDRLIAGTIISISWILLTRGLHIDGLGDTVDALGSVKDRVKRLEIMKDPHIGACGVTGIVLILFLKIVSIGAMDPGTAGPGILITIIIARYATIIFCSLFKYARNQGLSSPFIGKSNTRHIIAAGIITAGICLPLDARITCISLVTIILAGIIIIIPVSRSLGGITGDVLGAGIEITEAVSLCVIYFLCG